MRKQAAGDGTDEEHDRRCEPAVPFHVVKLEEVGVREEVAVDAGQDDAGEGVVLQRPARDGLPATLEGDQGDGHQDVPADVVASSTWAERHQRGCYDDEENLEGKRGAEDPSALGREVSVEAAEQEGSDAEAREGGAGLDPSRRLVGCREPEPNVDRVPCVTYEYPSRRRSYTPGAGSCYIPVCIDTNEPQMDIEALSRRPVIR